MPPKKAQPAPISPTNALFDALLAVQPRKIMSLLKGSSAKQLQHTGPCGITYMHLAVMSGFDADILAALAAAGAPLNAAVQCGVGGGRGAELRKMQSRAVPKDVWHTEERSHFRHLKSGYTPLALAARWIL